MLRTSVSSEQRFGGRRDEILISCCLLTMRLHDNDLTSKCLRCTNPSRNLAYIIPACLDQSSGATLTRCSTVQLKGQVSESPWWQHLQRENTYVNMKAHEYLIFWRRSPEDKNNASFKWGPLYEMGSKSYSVLSDFLWSLAFLLNCIIFYLNVRISQPLVLDDDDAFHSSPRSGGCGAERRIWLNLESKKVTVKKKADFTHSLYQESFLISQI